MPVGEVSADDKLVVGLDHPDCRNDKLVGGKGSQLADFFYVCVYSLRFYTRVTFGK